MSNNRVRKIKQEVQYALRKGARVTGIDASALAHELELLHSKQGMVSPEVYVLAAENPDSPLHSTLEWDNDKAGSEYRLQQARQIIRSVVVVSEQNSAPMFVHVNREHGYQPAQAVVNSPDLYVIALTGLQSKVNEAKRAVDDLMRLAEGRSDMAPERLARLTLAVQSLQTAQAAVQGLH